MKTAGQHFTALQVSFILRHTGTPCTWHSINYFTLQFSMLLEVGSVGRQHRHVTWELVRNVFSGPILAILNQNSRFNKISR